MPVSVNDSMLCEGLYLYLIENYNHESNPAQELLLIDLAKSTKASSESCYWYALLTLSVFLSACALYISISKNILRLFESEVSSP